ncbi:HD domain-containing protein [Alcaligenes faecalis]|uniref:5'-deoxynucleotidase n=1 Tax=Alcaligenes ammonioxydans TaxID=2582914 RepID=A0ABX8SS92_9BURK|nr:HD domain-containing protein [Alcaligenes ammonioxydans]QXX78911.1 HD domain-containing protein [Alcaligenes ammonioxydans]HRK86422.1 HD domain-containing protein [Alcaligenes faecalis]
MDRQKLESRLAFLEEAERLKSVLRSGHTSTGRPESTAEHSWRLCLMAMLFQDELGDLDMLKVLKICLVHDLGEALHGDISAIEKDQHPDKSEQERADMAYLTCHLDATAQAGILGLWEEYENASSAEARMVKALDKLETILQHTQGRNPQDFDYGFNLTYGEKYTAIRPFLARLRQILDEKTRARMDERAGDADKAGA